MCKVFAKIYNTKSSSSLPNNSVINSSKTAQLQILSKPDPNSSSTGNVKIGGVLQEGDMLFRVNKISTSKTAGDLSLQQTADGVYLVINVTVRNIGSSQVGFDESTFQVLNSDGSKSFSTSLIFENGEYFLHCELNPDIQKTGNVYFDMPENLANSKDLFLNVQAPDGSVMSLGSILLQ